MNEFPFPEVGAPPWHVVVLVPRVGTNTLRRITNWYYKQTPSLAEQQNLLLGQLEYQLLGLDALCFRMRVLLGYRGLLVQQGH
jgi:hypothetical protein